MEQHHLQGKLLAFIYGGANNHCNNIIRDLTIANSNNATDYTASVGGIVLSKCECQNSDKVIRYIIYQTLMHRLGTDFGIYFHRKYRNKYL